MRRTHSFLLAAALLWCAAAPAQDGAALFQQQCASCHAITAPDPAAGLDVNVERIRSRKGPDLYHAGDKFQAEWLKAWLVKPQRIRPGGAFYGDHIEATDEGDRIAEATLEPHPALDADAAEAITAFLMEQHAPAGRIKSGAYTPGSAADARMGSLLFAKLRGCSACHQSAPDKGGRSGPELYSAGDRLQPDYILSYIANPQALDPGVWMPALGLSDQDLKRLTAYLLGLKAEN
jgi:mono/diheme cytochrome c family protein